MKFTYEDIIQQLEKKIYHPIYFLTGDESYFIDEIARKIETNVLTDNEKEFNLTIFYGREVNAQLVREQAMRYPMMSDYQVVIVREAHEIPKIDGLTTYFKNPQQSTILVLCYKSKVPKNLQNSIEKYTCYFESKKISITRLPQWIQSFVIQHGYSITEKASYLLVESIGDDLKNIINELQKILINIPENCEITEDNIQEFIGFSRGYSIYEWIEALSLRNEAKANSIMFHLSKLKDKDLSFITLPLLFDFFIKVLIYLENVGKYKIEELCAKLEIKSWQLKRYEIAAKHYSRPNILWILHQIRIYDLKNKGVENLSFSGTDLLIELNAKILHSNELCHHQMVNQL